MYCYISYNIMRKIKRACLEFKYKIVPIHDVTNINCNDHKQEYFVEQL